MMRLKVSTSQGQYSLLAFSMFIVLCLGCSAGDTGGIEIDGSVSFRGENLAEGVIFFEPTPVQGRVGVSAEIVDGAFSIPASKSLRPGKYRVQISSMKPTGRKVIDSDSATPGAMMDEIGESIPMRYNLSSQLTCDLTAGQTEPLEFSLD